MTHSGPARRLMVIVDEDASVAHKPLYDEIIRRARASGLAGASAFRGIEGFGHTGQLHTSRILDLAENLPVLIVIVDTAESIAGFLPQLEELGVRGVIAIDDVEVIASGPSAKPR